MTKDQILTIARQFAEYQDTKEVTLRGEGVVQFARALMDADQDGKRYRWIREQDGCPFAETDDAWSRNLLDAHIDGFISGRWVAEAKEKYRIVDK